VEQGHRRRARRARLDGGALVYPAGRGTGNHNRDGDNIMNIDPREQAHGYDDWRVEDVPEPEMPEDRSEVRQVPEAVAAADVTKRKDTTVETAATDQITDAAEAAEVEQKLEE